MSTRKNTQVLIALSLSALLSVSHAQTIYKTVDEEGNVSYSSVKPEGNAKADIVEPPREPTAEEVEAARQRQRELEESVEALRERRKLKEVEEALTDSQKSNTTRVEQQVLPVPVLREPRVPRPRPLPTVRPAPPAAVPF